MYVVIVCILSHTCCKIFTLFWHSFLFLFFLTEFFKKRRILRLHRIPKVLKILAVVYYCSYSFGLFWLLNFFLLHLRAKWLMLSRKLWGFVIWDWFENMKGAVKTKSESKIELQIKSLLLIPSDQDHSVVNLWPLT